MVARLKECKLAVIMLLQVKCQVAREGQSSAVSVCSALCWDILSGFVFWGWRGWSWNYEYKSRCTSSYCLLSPENILYHLPRHEFRFGPRIRQSQDQTPTKSEIFQKLLPVLISFPQSDSSWNGEYQSAGKNEYNRIATCQGLVQEVVVWLLCIIITAILVRNILSILADAGDGELEIYNLLLLYFNFFAIVLLLRFASPSESVVKFSLGRGTLVAGFDTEVSMPFELLASSARVPREAISKVCSDIIGRLWMTAEVIFKSLEAKRRIHTHESRLFVNWRKLCTKFRSSNSRYQDS